MAKESPIPGVLLLSASVPITAEDIADEAALSVEETQQALEAFIVQDMLEIIEDGVLRLINWDERQFESDNSSERSRRHRNKKQSNVSATDLQRCSNVAATPPDTDTEADTEVLSSPNGDSSPELFGDGDLVEEGGEERVAKTQVPYLQIVDLYHECCPSLAKVRQLTKKRRQLIKARWPGSLEPFRLVFSRAEQSDFLTGRKPSRDHPSWVADLEFILREESWAKISEGKYDNRGAPVAMPKIPPAYQSIFDAVARRRERDLRGDGGNCDSSARSIP
jgi:hypothetical protein